VKDRIDASVITLTVIIVDIDSTTCENGFNIET
jgi:hypothetical protein